MWLNKARIANNIAISHFFTLQVFLSLFATCYVSPAVSVTQFNCSQNLLDGRGKNLHFKEIYFHVALTLNCD